MEVSVDDRRALWALTERCLRSRTFGAVLLVRSALRAGAEHIDVSTRGALRVVDDGQSRGAELSAIVDVLRAPLVPALHALEARFGTDLLVALATAKDAEIRTAGHHVHLQDGRVVDVGEAPLASTGRTEVLLRRDSSLRKEERTELRAWLPAPRAALVVDGRTWRRAPRLPPNAFFSRAFSADGGKGLLAFSLGDAVSKTTVLARGLWVAQDTRRPKGLPTVAVWDDDDVSSGDHALQRARTHIDNASRALVRALADDFAGLEKKKKHQLRSLLLRAPALPDAFDDVPLFDEEGAAFSVSFKELRQRSRVVIGKSNADVIVDGETRAFLHRALPSVKDALPRPRRRFFYVLGFR